MGGLIFKEFHENRIQLIICYTVMIAAHVLALSGALLQPDDMTSAEDLQMFRETFILIVYAMSVVGISCLMTAIFRYDETRLWSCFIQSTPQMAAGQVKSKYLFVLANYFITLTVLLLADFANTAINGISAFSLGSLCFWIAVIFNAVEIPFIIRFGSKKGGMIRVIVTIILILAGTTAILFTDKAKSGEVIKSVIEPLISGKVSGGMLWFMALLPIISMALYYLSYKLSCRVYAKGAECYER